MSKVIKPTKSNATIGSKAIVRMDRPLKMLGNKVANIEGYIDLQILNPYSVRFLDPGTEVEIVSPAKKYDGINFISVKIKKTSEIVYIYWILFSTNFDMSEESSQSQSQLKENPSTPKTKNQVSTAQDAASFWDQLKTKK